MRALLQARSTGAISPRHPGTAQPCLRASPSLPVLLLRPRDVRACTTKNPGISDFADVKPGRQTKPMERAEKDFDLKDMVSKCSEWQQIKALVTESPHKFEKDNHLTCAALMRAAEVIGPLPSIKKGAERTAAKGFLNHLADLLIPQMNWMRGQQICGLVLALKRLRYTQPKLIQGVFYYLAEKERKDKAPPPSVGEDRPKKTFVFTVAERFALLATFSQMGVRPPPEAIVSVLENSFSYMKFCTPDDISNLSQALHGWHGKLRAKFAGRLAIESQKHLSAMDGRSLVSLMSLLGAASYCASTFTASEFFKALEPHMAALPEPGLYPSLMYALMRMRVKIPPDLFDDMCTLLMGAPKAVAGRKATQKERAAPRVEALSVRELVVVLGVLGVQHKYTPEKAFLDKVMACLQDRSSELSAAEAASALTLLPAVLTEADSREDACEVVDELLAVMEAGLPEMRASQMQRVAQTLAALGHAPDSFWTEAFLSEVQGRVVGEAKASAQTGRPGLVSLAGAYAALPKPAVTREEAAAFASSLARQGSSLGGFREEQLEQLRLHLVALGLEAATLELPVADQVAEPRLNADEQSADNLPDDSNKLHRDTPGDFLGFAELDYDLEEVTRAVAMFRTNAELEARATAAGRERARAARQDPDAGYGAQEGGWFGGGDAEDGSWLLGNEGRALQVDEAGRSPQAGLGQRTRHSDYAYDDQAASQFQFDEQEQEPPAYQGSSHGRASSDNADEGLWSGLRSDVFRPGADDDDGMPIVRSTRAGRGR